MLSMGCEEVGLSHLQLSSVALCMGTSEAATFLAR